MKTLLVSLALVFGTSMILNAQTQTQSTQTAKPATTVHSTSQPNTTHTGQAQAAQAQTKVMIKSADLPKTIKENLASQFKGWTEGQAYKMDTKGVISYEVMVKKEKNEMILFYDKDGKFMKQEPVAMKPTENKQMTVPAKTSQAPKK